jgi:AraC family transcriptional regulator of arabinose operon
MPAPRRLTPAPAYVDLVSGYFRRGPRYSAFRPGGTDDWLLIATLDGAGRFGHAGDDLVTAAGDLVLLPPNVPHDYSAAAAVGRWDLLWVHFHPRPHWMDALAWPVLPGGVMHLHIPPGVWRQRITDRFFALHRRATSAERRREWLAMNALEELLLWCDRFNPRAEQSRLDPRILDAMNQVCRGLEQKHTLSSMADVAGLSASRFAHLFREQTGTTPQQFIELQRLGRARTLMEMTPLSIKEIARQVGFDNPFYFTLRFRKHFGLSPREARTTRQPRG